MPRIPHRALLATGALAALLASASAVQAQSLDLAQVFERVCVGAHGDPGRVKAAAAALGLTAVADSSLPAANGGFAPLFAMTAANGGKQIYLILGANQAPLADPSRSLHLCVVGSPPDPSQAAVAAAINAWIGVPGQPGDKNRVSYLFSENASGARVAAADRSKAADLVRTGAASMVMVENGAGGLVLTYLASEKSN
jgi:hypothetical protein